MYILAHLLSSRRAGVAELVDAPDSKSGFFGSASSILALGTIIIIKFFQEPRILIKAYQSNDAFHQLLFLKVIASKAR